MTSLSRLIDNKIKPLIAEIKILQQLIINQQKLDTRISIRQAEIQFQVCGKTLREKAKKGLLGADNMGGVITLSLNEVAGKYAPRQVMRKV